MVAAISKFVRNPRVTSGDAQHGIASLRACLMMSCRMQESREPLEPPCSPELERVSGDSFAMAVSSYWKQGLPDSALESRYVSCFSLFRRGFQRGLKHSLFSSLGQVGVRQSEAQRRVQ